MTNHANTKNIYIWLYRIDSTAASDAIKPYGEQFGALSQYKHNSQPMRNFSFMMRRIILSGVTKTPLRELDFHHNPAGKPMLINSSIHFSISHSGAFWCMAVREGEEIGLDIERIRKRKYETEIVTSYFLQHEQDLYFKEQSASKRTALFFQLWTEKEAIAKMHGVSLLELLANKQPSDKHHITRLDKRELAIAIASSKNPNCHIQFMSDTE